MSGNDDQSRSSEPGAVGSMRPDQDENRGMSVTPGIAPRVIHRPPTFSPNNNTSILLRPPPLYAPLPPRSPSHRQETRLRPIGPGNHDRAWNDPPMFSLDANTRPSGQRSRLNERVAFPMQGVPSNSPGGYIAPPSELPGPRLFVPLPPGASAVPPMAPMVEDPQPFIPEPPPPPPGSGDCGQPLVIFYGNLPQPITAPHTTTYPAGPTILNHPNVLNDS